MLRVSYDDLEGDESGIYYWQGKPFTGIAYENHPNGQQWSEAEMLNGQLDGYERDWYPSGQIESVGYCKSGERYSWSREWFENGKLRRESVFERGICVMEKIWDEQGQLISKYVVPSFDEKSVKLGTGAK